MVKLSIDYFFYDGDLNNVQGVNKSKYFYYNGSIKKIEKFVLEDDSSFVLKSTVFLEWYINGNLIEETVYDANGDTDNQSICKYDERRNQFEMFPLWHYRLLNTNKLVEFRIIHTDQHVQLYSSSEFSYNVHGYPVTE